MDRHKALVFAYTKTALTPPKELGSVVIRLKKYSNTLRDALEDSRYTRGESSVHLPFDKTIARAVEDMVAATVSRGLKYVIVIGIGGSNLGARAVYEALYGKNGARVPLGKPQLLFLDTADPHLYEAVNRELKAHVKHTGEVLINLISKSGNTTESVANFEVLYAELKRRLGTALRNRVVVTTDEGSALWNAAQAHRFKTLSMPRQVGGRFSMFSAVGLFPLAAVGIDIATLLKGARDITPACMSADVHKNFACASAGVLYVHRRKGLRTYNQFFFNPDLETLGAWSSQLMAESIGKERNDKGKIVHEGILPLVSIGSTHLHSLSQLYFGGPRLMVTTFIYAPNTAPSTRVPRTVILKHLKGIAGVPLSGIMGALYGGVKRSYQKHGLPFMELVLPALDVYSMGQYMQMKLFEIMYLAHMLGVNAFDQPNVEDYKQESRQLLQAQR